MLSLITCTGGRPEAFALLEKYMLAQTFRGRVEWIVVDDCDPPTPTTCGQIVIRPDTVWQPGMRCTMNHNLAVALSAISGHKILFIEDDEAYRPDYLKTMSLYLEERNLVGQYPARYYHVGVRRYKIHPNRSHASLCQTGIAGATMWAHVLNLCAHEDPFLDLTLWRKCGPEFGMLREGYDVVSIKGMPGRPGVGMGHRPQRAIANRRGYWQDDASLAVLTEWVGEELAAGYAVYKCPG